MPTCSRTTFAIHAGKIRRSWSANWMMWSYSSCAKLPNVQCSQCLLFWNQGIWYCTCGQYLIDSESRRKFNKLRLDALSIPNYVIKKGRSHGARHGKTKVQRAYHLAWKKADSLGEHFTGVHDRFLRDPVYRESQLAIGWTEQRWKELDELAKEDLSFRLTPEEKRRYQAHWYLTLNKSGKNGLMKLRSDFRAAVSLKNRLLHESGEQIEEPNSAEQYSFWHLSSSTSWWNKNCKWAHNFLTWSLFCYSWFHLQSMAIHCDRREVWTDTFHTFFSHALCTSDCVHTHRMAQDEPRSNVSLCAFDSRCWSSFCPSLVSLRLLTSSLPHSTRSFSGTPSSMSTPPRVKTTALTENEEYCTMAIFKILPHPDPSLTDLLTALAATFDRRQPHKVPLLHPARAVHEVVTGEYRILESVNYEVETCTRTGRLGELIEVRFSLRAQQLQQRFPQVTRSLLSCVFSVVLDSGTLCIASNHVRDRPYSLDTMPSPIGSSAWFFSCMLWVCLCEPGLAGVTAALVRSASLGSRPLALSMLLSLAHPC